AGLVGQAQVEENNVRTSGGNLFQAPCARLGDLNPVSRRGEHVAHSVAKQVRVVIDQQQVRHGLLQALSTDLESSLYFMNSSRAGSEMIQPESTDHLRQAEQELRERERQLDSLMGHLPGLAYRALADEHWTCLFVSKGIEAVTGYAPDDFTSRRGNCIDPMLPQDRRG